MTRANRRRDRGGIARHRRRDQQGSAAVELTLLAPALLVTLLFVVGLTRMADASQQVESVAADAARAASLERDSRAAVAVAHQAARSSIDDADLSCSPMSVDAEVGSYVPGGSVRVTISCTAELGDVAMAGFPGSKRFTATSVVPIETYRAQ